MAKKPTCQKCNSTSVNVKKDRDGLFASCMICGWHDTLSNIGREITRKQYDPIVYITDKKWGQEPVRPGFIKTRAH